MAARRIEYLMKKEALTRAEAKEYVENNPRGPQVYEPKERKCDQIKRLRKEKNIAKKAAEKMYKEERGCA